MLCYSKVHLLNTHRHTHTLSTQWDDFAEIHDTVV